MLINVVQVGIDDDRFSGEFPMESRIFGGVEGYKLIGHDASSTIDDAMFLERIELQ